MNGFESRINIFGIWKMGTNYARILYELWCWVDGFDISDSAIATFKKNLIGILDGMNTYQVSNGGILVKPHPTIVSVNTPDHERVIRALVTQHNVRKIISEKPLWLNLEHSRQIIELAKSKKVDLYTAFIIRYSPVIQKIILFMKENNLFMQEGKVIWWKDRTKDTRPTAWDLEDEAVHGMDILFLLADLLSKIDSFRIEKAELEYKDYVNKEAQEAQNQRDPSYPLKPNSSSSVTTLINTVDWRKIKWQVDSSFVMDKEVRKIDIVLAWTDGSEYMATMNFDMRQADGTVRDTLDISKSWAIIETYEQTNNKLKVQTQAWISSLWTNWWDVDARLAWFDQSYAIALWTDAVQKIAAWARLWKIDIGY